MQDALVVRVAIVAAVLAVVAWRMNAGPVDGGEPGNQDDTITDEIMNKIDEGIAMVSAPGPVAEMSTSEQAKRMMRAFESCRLKPYNLNDGVGGSVAWTIGWGHQYTKFETVAQSITQAQADAMFDDDVASRGESKVKLYVTVPLTQCQFDALVDISFGLSVKGFKKFAANVNAGNGLDGIAESSVAWVAAIYQNGIRRRRVSQVAMFDQGVYT